MKYLILKNGLIIAEFHEKGYALDFIEYQSSLGKEFTLAIQNDLRIKHYVESNCGKENK